MLTFEVPLVRVRVGGSIQFAERPRLPKPPKASEAARTLALGHRIVRAVESGQCRSYTEAARRMRVSLPRVSVLVALTFLAPEIQEDLLCGSPSPTQRNFKHLCNLARMERWSDQLRQYRAPSDTEASR